ncbi:MAG TPA: methionyl-tRNA formyltransferase [Patescibacteria group bacterium]|nr:methionyl-tRNA formyltransferase [Patescibacteria group bacterium]
MSVRIVFMGTPELARTSLESLLGCPEFEIVGVVTQPDRPKGRNLQPTPSAVKELSLQKGLPLFQPAKARDEQFLSELGQLKADLIAVAAYGQILPPALLDLPRHGCLNVHTSILPKYRGAAPIQWAILNDDSETGVTIMKMEIGLDTGAIVSQQRTLISEADDAESLQHRLAQLGARLLVQTIPGYVSGTIHPVPQPEQGVSYARKITKNDGLIDWTRPARVLWNQVRALTPWPVAFTRAPGAGPGLLRIWRAEPAEGSAPPGEIISADKHGIVVGCGQQALRILLLQREGARRLTPQQFLAGCPLHKGAQLGGNN